MSRIFARLLDATVTRQQIPRSLPLAWNDD
jgi:hypothetical protein